jgi:hypothetical protein
MQVKEWADFLPECVCVAKLMIRGALALFVRCRVDLLLHLS